MNCTASKLRHLLLTTFGTCLLFYSCQKTKETTNEAATDPTLDNIVFETPNGWPPPVYNFEDNRLAPKGFKSGRTPFPEPILPNYNTVTCSSCHQPFAKVEQIEHNISHGLTKPPSLFNLNWHGWVQHIEQPIDSIIHSSEMGDSIENAINKTGQRERYRAFFKEAYGSEKIRDREIFKSMEQFMSLLVSSL